MERDDHFLIGNKISGFQTCCTARIPWPTPRSNLLFAQDPALPGTEERWGEDGTV